MMSLGLALVMCFTLSVPAFAKDTSSKNATNDVTVLDNDSKLVAQDFDNGNSEISFVTDGETTYTVYVDRASNTLKETAYCDGNVVSSNTSHVPTSNPTIASIANSSGSYTYKGTVTYQYYDTVPGTRDLSFAYLSSSRNTGYNINKRFQNVAALAGVLSLGLAVPGLIADEIALSVLKYVGFASTATGFFIGSVDVACVDIQMTWKLTDSGGYSSYMSGDKYVVTEDGNYRGNTYYEGDFWATSAYAEHNTAFAQRAYEIVYNTRDSVTITWG